MATNSRHMDTNERVANERVDHAVSLVRSAFRLHTLDPISVLDRLRYAMEEGVEDQAKDVGDALRRRGA